MPDFPPLVADELVLWEGAPDTALRLSASTLAGSLFAAALFLACLGLATVIERSTPGVYLTILGPGLGVAAIIGVTFPVLDQRARQNTAYRLTNKRAVIRKGGRSDSIALPPPDQIQLTGSEPQSLVFGRDRTGRPVMFERLPEAQTVYTLMRDAAEADGMTDTVEHAKDTA